MNKEEQRLAMISEWYEKGQPECATRLLSAFSEEDRESIHNQLIVQYKKEIEVYEKS